MKDSHHTHQESPRQTGRFSIGRTLSDDHAHLERVFQSLVTRAYDGDPVALREEWDLFDRELTSHLAFEESEILPPFAHHHEDEALGLLEEHAKIRAQLAEMGINLDLHCLRAEDVDAFIELLRAHARREDELLYPWASRQLGGRSRSGLRKGLVALIRRPPASS